MATTITTTTGATPNTRYNYQRKIDRCRNGTLWAMIHNSNSSRLEFWFSTNDGASWSEDSSQRIDSVDTTASASMRIGTRADGAERLGVVYVRNSHVRANLGNFRDNRQSFTWQQSNVILTTAGQSSFWRYPDCEVVPLGSYWIVPAVWSRLIDGKAYLWFSRARWGESGNASVTKARVLHERVATIHTKPSLAVRHLSDDDNIYTGAPDLYVAWAHGDSADPEPRQYMMRMTSSGTNWNPGIVRVLREAGVHSSVTAAAYTGKVFACVRAPYDDGTEDPTSLQLQLMDPSDSVREAIDVPALGSGNMANVGITWDNYTGDIYIIAAGATNQNPKFIRYLWAPRQFDATWTTIIADGANGDSLSVKPGSRHNRIEILYSIVSGADTAARYELADTTNTLPSTATWVTETGAKNRSANLLLEWSHNDVDDDAQGAYTLEKRVNGGAAEYWNGSAWQTSLVNVSSATQSVTLSSGWATAGDTVEFRVRTSDAVGFGPYSTGLPILATTIINPTITSPANLANITVPQLTVEWTVDEQSAYRVRLLDVVGDPVYDSDWVGEPNVRVHEIPFDLVNGATYDVELTTQNAAGLASTPQTVEISVSLTPPPTPVLTETAVPDDGAIDVAIDNGTPGGGEAAADNNDLVRIDPDGIETLIAIFIEANTTFRDYGVAHEVVYTYRAKARTAAGATIESV